MSFLIERVRFLMPVYTQIKFLYASGHQFSDVLKLSIVLVFELQQRANKETDEQNTKCCCFLHHKLVGVDEI